jgi:SAM-dependent methyltransferase
MRSGNFIMTANSTDRWNKRYKEETILYIYKKPRGFLLENLHLLRKGGLILDVAAGMGGNAHHLVSLGYRVLAIDSAQTGMQFAKLRSPALMAVIMDVNHFSFPADQFDAILNFYFLERELWPLYQRALKPGGILIMETLTMPMRQIKPEINPIYLLEPGELRTAFPDLKCLTYREGWVLSDNGHRRSVASLVARKPVQDNES